MICFAPIRKSIPRLRSSRGQALIETALTVPFLMLILVGGVEVGRISYAAIEVANAAKAAVQYGAQSNTTARDATGMQTAAANDAGQLGNLTVTPTLSLACSDGSAPQYPIYDPNQNQDCPGADIEVVVTVDVQGTFHPLLHFPGLPTAINLYGHASEVVLGSN